MINQSLKVLYRHAPITTPSSGNEEARRREITDAGKGSGKIWVQSSVTVFVLLGGDTVNATGADGATDEIELLVGSAQPIIDTGGAAYVSIKAASDARVVIQEVA